MHRHAQQQNPLHNEVALQDAVFVCHSEGVYTGSEKLPQPSITMQNETKISGVTSADTIREASLNSAEQLSRALQTSD